MGTQGLMRFNYNGLATAHHMARSTFLGAELWDTGAITTTGESTVASVGTYNVTSTVGAASTVASTTFNGIAGRLYRVTLTVSSLVGSILFCDVGGPISSVGTFTFDIRLPATVNPFFSRGAFPTAATITAISVREVK